MEEPGCRGEPHPQGPKLPRPVDEIRANDYDLSINKYKEVEKVKVDYEDPAVVLGRIQALQKEIATGLAEFQEKYL